MLKLTLGFICLFQPLFASVFCHMNSIEPISCDFSLQHHNRILVEGGRIKKMIFPEDQLSVRLEETSGQAFVQARPGHRQNVLLSVISTSGIVQDIEITFKDVSSQVVVLRATEDAHMDLTTLSECSIPTCYTPDTVVAQILKGSIPSGYQSVSTTQSKWKVRRGVEAILIGCLKGCEENLFLYRVHNKGLWKKCVSEKDFTRACPAWVFVQDQNLAAKDSTLAIVAVPL